MNKRVLKSAVYFDRNIGLVERLFRLKFREAGNYLRAAFCPFHVDEERNFLAHLDYRGEVRFRCRGLCNREFDIFNLIRMKKGCSLLEAVLELADAAGINGMQIDIANEPSGQSHAADGPTVFIPAVETGPEWQGYLAGAALAYDTLLAGSRHREKILRFLRAEGIHEENLRDFEIGFAPGPGGPEDRLAGRIIFPVRDMDARIQGFLGYLPDSSAHDTNPPATTPGKVHLYGLEKSHAAIRRHKTVILVGDLFEYFRFYNLLSKEDLPAVLASLTADGASVGRCLHTDLGVETCILASGSVNIPTGNGTRIVHLDRLLPGGDVCAKVRKAVDAARNSASGRHAVCPDRGLFDLFGDNRRSAPGDRRKLKTFIADDRRRGVGDRRKNTPSIEAWQCHWKKVRSKYGN